MALGLCLIDCPDHGGHKQDDIDNLARVEGHAETVDEEQLEPSAHGDDARNDTIEHCCQNDQRDAKGDERALQVGIRETAVVVDQSDGGYTEQVEQVDANGESRQIHDQHEPTVAVRLVGHIVPLQDEPEYRSREC